MAEILTARTALRLDVFQRTVARVYAGEQHLDRPVRWVHTGEIPDIHRFLSGHEMLLTAGLGMGDTPERQRAFVRRVADARASVLVVELAGRMFDEMPAAAIEEAEAAGLPLVGLLDEIPFAEASAQVHEMLVEGRVAQLLAEEEAGQAFLNLLLSDQDYLAMVEELSRRTGMPAVLENVAHQMLAYAGATAESDAAAEDWAAHSRAMHELHRPAITDGSAAPVAKAGSFREVAACARRPVVLRGESWGWLHLLHGAAAPAPADLHALERASAAVAISLLSERESGARSAQRQGALLNRLMLGEISGEDFVRLARTLGRDLRSKTLVVFVSALRDSPDQSPVHSADSVLHGLDASAVVGDLGDFALSVVAPGRRTTAAAIEAALAGAGHWGGVSRTVPAAALPAAVRQGRSAAAAASATSAGHFLHFDDLGALRLLVTLAEGPELARYVEDEIGALLANDARSTNPLLPTLRAFLDAAGNKARAAEMLFVQRRTLYYRLDRISALLGLDLSSSESQQRLQLAVRGHDLLRRPVARRP
ncbi:PucR family transcriptional regulator [Amycolatopsis sp. Poz14]|uniref:PucR family transcriptional regulator n=1 Tax=Amycolatopsis sp. Poz14 TaxID=1447705 RepID=UPI001EE981EC|nr:PucR family transcriptional regulator [Amycolatopsis sp. Poz14]MCG3754751.1 PucR family transcriptional regulator [Amycolatopsis sp. Poz14]